MNLKKSYNVHQAAAVPLTAIFILSKCKRYAYERWISIENPQFCHSPYYLAQHQRIHHASAALSFHPLEQFTLMKMFRSTPALIA